MKKLLSTALLALVALTGWAQSDLGPLAETMWRNEQTGDWDIGFTEKYAIYDCKLWDYDYVRPKGNKVVMALTNNGEKVDVVIDKEKKGKRQMLVNGKKQTYSLITTSELPNYPTKDLTPFKDNGYQAGDSVTFVGWLKDLPKEVLDRNRKYVITTYSIFTREATEYSGDIDDEGHFVVKVPVENSQQVYTDWGRTSIVTVLEPGETYFLLIDGAHQKRLVMGRNARVQNELMAHPYKKAYAQYHEHRIMSEERLLAYKDQWAGMYQHNQAMLDSIMNVNPTLSRKFEDFHRLGDIATTAEELMQSCLYAEGGKLPQTVKDYVDSLLWPNIIKPYTIARDMSYLLYYYSSDAEHGSSKYKQSVTIDSNSLLQMEKDGLIKYSEKDRALLKRFQDMSDEFKQAKEEDYEALNEKHKELIEQFNAFFQRDDVQAAIEESVDAIETEVAISDSIYPDALLRDFSRAQKLYERLDHNRKPLNRTQMAVLNQIQLPAVRSALLAENDKFVNMQKAEVANAECLRPSSDVEGLTDGEAILRKILEPFKGRIVYLDIWGTWCGPCKDKLKESHFVKDQLKDFDIVYLYLANTSPEESWKNVIKEYNLTGPNCVHYNLPKSQQRAVEQFLKVESFPTYKLIDKQGNIHDLHWLHTDDMKTFKETIANLN